MTEIPRLLILHGFRLEAFQGETKTYYCQHVRRHCGGRQLGGCAELNLQFEEQQSILKGDLNHSDNLGGMTHMLIRLISPIKTDGINIMIYPLLSAYHCKIMATPLEA